MAARLEGRRLMSFATTLKDRYRRSPRTAWVALLLLALCILVLVVVMLVTGPCEHLFVEPASDLPEIDEPPTIADLSIYNVDRPFDVAIDPSGERIYVTETGGARRVRVFNRNGEEIASLTPPDSTSPGNRCPHYVTIDEDGIVYVSDQTRYCIDMYDENDLYLGKFAEGWIPSGMSWDTAGEKLYVCNRSEHCVMVFDRMGNLLDKWGTEGNEEGQFSHPNGIAIDQDGRVYVADSNNDRLQVFDSERTTITQFTLPRGVAMDNRGRMYAVGAQMHTVQVFMIMEEGLEPLFSFGDGPGIDDQSFRFPNGLCIDNEGGRVYVADKSNDRIQVWEY